MADHPDPDAATPAPAPGELPIDVPGRGVRVDDPNDPRVFDLELFGADGEQRHATIEHPAWQAARARAACARQYLSPAAIEAACRAIDPYVDYRRVRPGDYLGRAYIDRETEQVVHVLVLDALATARARPPDAPSVVTRGGYLGLSETEFAALAKAVRLEYTYTDESDDPGDADPGTGTDPT